MTSSCDCQVDCRGMTLTGMTKDGGVLVMNPHDRLICYVLSILLSFHLLLHSRVKKKRGKYKKRVKTEGTEYAGKLRKGGRPSQTGLAEVSEELEQEFVK